MNIQKYLEETKKIQASLLNFLDMGDNIEENFQNLNQLFTDIKINDNQHLFQSFLHLIMQISNHHYHQADFYSKIEKILLFFSKNIKLFYSNSKIFNIFGSNKRILLLLLEKNILTMDENIFHKITSNDQYIKANYLQYFSPEIKPFITEKWLHENREKLKDSSQKTWINYIMKEKLPDGFYEKRKNGENDQEICQIIQKDLIEQFIIYVNKNLYSLKSTIEESIYETNLFFIKKQIKTNKNDEENDSDDDDDNDNEHKTSLIEYAAYYGSNQIFNYLRLNNVELTPSLWIYAIHSQNEEIINILQDSDIKPKHNSFLRVFKESIKCHHIDAANYIESNYLNDINLDDILIKSLKYYNFYFIRDDFINNSLLLNFCKYDYYIIVDNLLQQKDIDINQIKDITIFFCNNVSIFIILIKLL